MAGRRWPVACVSLEVTQRCNLDCTLCYLSDSSESVLDFPLEEVLRRVDLIARHYGPGTDVQVSGGEPTLRPPADLLRIVSHIAQHGMRATLMTNGIKATRSLLTQLAAAGLTDVAFHVDTTQERAGYTTEADLNPLRREYIERARGLPLSVFFNTTVHAGNFDQIEALTGFFVSQADVVRFVSFQLQADTGRGVLRGRDDVISNDSVARRLAAGAGTPLSWNVLSAGHHDCNRLAVSLVVDGRVIDVLADSEFIQRFMRETTGFRINRRTPWRSLVSLVQAAAARPALAWASVGWVASLVRQHWRGLLAARGRVHKLTFFTHNFMDACQLDADRLDACVFLAVTQDGPLSMCAYNAQRDDFLLKPLATSQGTWSPLRPGYTDIKAVPVKWLKGRARETALKSLHSPGDRTKELNA